jgi:hypothetical protein
MKDVLAGYQSFKDINLSQSSTTIDKEYFWRCYELIQINNPDSIEELS